MQRIVDDQVGVPRVTTSFEDELGRLYREAAPKLWRSLYGYTGGRRQLSEDALAEAFALALEHEGTIRQPLPWIYRTAFRLATRELKAERRRPPPVPDAVPGIDPGEVIDIVRALGTLSSRQRAAVILHDQEGFTAPEAGRLLGISAATVRVHLFRGRSHLRSLLTEEDAS